MNHSVRVQLLQQLDCVLLTHSELEPEHHEEGGLPQSGELLVFILPQGLKNPQLQSIILELLSLVFLQFIPILVEDLHSSVGAKCIHLDTTRSTHKRFCTEMSQIYLIYDTVVA